MSDYVYTEALRIAAPGADPIHYSESLRWETAVPLCWVGRTPKPGDDSGNWVVNQDSDVALRSPGRGPTPRLEWWGSNMTSDYMGVNCPQCMERLPLFIRVKAGGGPDAAEAYIDLTKIIERDAND